MFYLLLGEIVLAVILTVLALAILAILVARWTRRRHNEARVSRYTSEQSAGLLDHEDGISHGRHKRGRGSRCSISSDSADGSNGCQPAPKPSCCQQLSIKPSCYQPAVIPSHCPPEALALPLLITQRASTKHGPPIIMKKQSDCKGQMIRHGGSVTFQDECRNPIPLKCCKELRRCQCQYCCPKRCESHMSQQREPVWCEEPAPSPNHQHPPQRQDSQVSFDQRNRSELDAQSICYEEPFLFRRLESLIRKNQDGIIIKQNEGGFLIRKAEAEETPPPECRKKQRSSRKSSEPKEADSHSSVPAPQTTEEPQKDQPPEESSEGEDKKQKKERKKKDKD